MTKTSAISISPALLACTASPQPGLTTTTVVSALPGDLDLDLADADGLDEDPRAGPTASSRRMASGVARARPPRWPRVAIERMNTPGSVAWSCMRTRSPRMAPPVNGDDGSMASTATSWPCARRWPMSALVSVDLPAPGRAGEPDGVGLAAERVGAGGRPRGPARRPARSATAGGPAPPGRRPGRRRAARLGIGVRRAAGALRPPPLSVTPSTRSFMIRSMPAFSVSVDAGHVPHAPTSVTVTTPVSSSTSRRKMSPPSACRAGRMASIVSSTCCRTRTSLPDGAHPDRRAGPGPRTRWRGPLLAYPAMWNASTSAACSRGRRRRAGRVRVQQGSTRATPPAPSPAATTAPGSTAGDQRTGHRRRRRDHDAGAATPRRPTRRSAVTSQRSSSTWRRPDPARSDASRTWRSARRSCSACCPTATRSTTSTATTWSRRLPRRRRGAFEFTADKAGSFEVESHTTDKVLATLQVT